VSAAGTTCLELAASGVPALLLVAAANQATGAAHWHRSGAFELLGALGDVPPARAAARLAALLDDPARLAAMASRAQALVPGAGAARTAAALIDAFALHDAAAVAAR
jgi:spore coat polysaccharide biosynthesis predicted glycosyltransferase SpsG